MLNKLNTLSITDCRETCVLSKLQAIRATLSQMVKQYNKENSLAKHALNEYYKISKWYNLKKRSLQEP